MLGTGGGQFGLANRIGVNLFGGLEEEGSGITSTYERSQLFCNPTAHPQDALPDVPKLTRLREAFFDILRHLRKGNPTHESDLWRATLACFTMCVDHEPKAPVFRRFHLTVLIPW